MKTSDKILISAGMLVAAFVSGIVSVGTFFFYFSIYGLKLSLFLAGVHAWGVGVIVMLFYITITKQDQTNRKDKHNKKRSSLRKS